jgi:tetratricopeptide (TPR) repeat protein
LSYSNLAVCLETLGRPNEALPLHRRALDIQLKLRGELHPDTALRYHGLASVLVALGRHWEALPLYRRALDIHLKVHGERHPDTARAFNGVALCLDQHGRHGEALPLYRRALDISLRVQGELHPYTASIYNNIARCLLFQGKHADALPLYRRVLNIRLKVLGEQHQLTAIAYASLAVCLDRLVRPGEVLSLDRRALAIRLKLFGEEHPDTAASYSNVGMDLHKQGKYAEAITHLQKALAIQQKVLGEEHPDTARSFNNLAACLNDQGRAQEALPLYRRALAIRQKALGEHHPDTASSYHNLAACLATQGRRAEALRLVQESLTGQEAALFHVASAGFDRAIADTEKASPHAVLAAGLARLGQPRNAFRHAEFALARGLLDDLTGTYTADRDRFAVTTAHLRSVDEQLVPLLGRFALSAEESALRDRLSQRRRALEADLRQLASAVSARQVLPRERIQRHIPADAALVLWIDVLGEHLGCVLRREGSPAWVTLPGSGKGGAWTAKDVELPRQAFLSLTAWRLSEEEKKNLLDKAEEKSRPFLKEALDPRRREELLAGLFRQRLAPLEPYLEGVRQLLVVPAGALAAVPVEALTDRWLVSYVPSGSAFARSAERSRRLEGSSLLVLADPVFARTPPKYPPAPPHGLLVTTTVPGGLAAKVGLRPGDVLLEYGGKKLRSPDDLRLGDGEERVAIKVWREGQALAGRIPSGELGVVLDKRPVAEALGAWRAEEISPRSSPRGKESSASAILAGTTVGCLSGGALSCVVAASCAVTYSPEWPPLPGTGW